MSVVVTVHACFQVGAAIPRGWRTSCDEHDLNDGLVGEAFALCRESESLVAAVVDMYRLITSAGKSTMVERSIIVRLDVQTSSRPTRKTIT